MSWFTVSWHIDYMCIYILLSIFSNWNLFTFSWYFGLSIVLSSSSVRQLEMKKKKLYFYRKVVQTEVVINLLTGSIHFNSTSQWHIHRFLVPSFFYVEIFFGYLLLTYYRPRSQKQKRKWIHWKTPLTASRTL